MAKIVSPVWSTIRGSIAGITYYSGPGHPILARQRVTPVNPHSIAQQQIRAVLSGRVVSWNTRTPAQRQAWDDYGQTVIRTTPTGSRTMTGRQCYIGGLGLVVYLHDYFAMPVTYNVEGPTEAGLVALEAVVVEPPTGPGTRGFKLNFVNLEGVAMGCLIDISIVLNPARNYWRGPYLATKTHSKAIIPIGTSSDENIGYTADQLGKRVFWRVRCVTMVSPIGVPARLSPLYEGSALIQASVP